MCPVPRDVGNFEMYRLTIHGSLEGIRRTREQVDEEIKDESGCTDRLVFYKLGT